MARLDHIVVVANDLSQGAGWVEAALGVAMAGGGVHEGLGTHNRLLSLGPDLYLEVIARNPQDSAPDQPRMFGLDNFSGETGLANWVLSSKNAKAALAQSPAGLGDLRALSRGDFRWLMTMPANGMLPFGGAFPALIQWQSQHPAPLLPDQGCRLRRLDIRHPDAQGLSQALNGLLNDDRVQISDGPEFEMQAHIETPEGGRVLAAAKKNQTPP